MSRPLFFYLAVFVASFLAQVSHAVYFYVADNKAQCFLQEVPADTAVVAKYANLDMDNLGFDPSSQVPTAMQIVVLDPDRIQVLTQVCEKKGSVAWTSAKAGEYSICVEVIHGRRQGQRYKFGMTFANGEKTIDYSALAKHEHLSAISVEVRKLIDRVNARRSEQVYQRTLEATFREETESMHTRIIVYSIFQSIVIISSGIAQIWRLRSFFKAKRLH